ncbi:MAG TPA: dihydrolipoamide acetyltransferase family protein [Gaiellaceae bacterium]|nr:dihydrolipoamide acetyltransferase family protein [Gaiellaceae bacterium]
MAAEVKVPRLGQGMESGTIVKWLKAEGDAVKKGEPLYELDTDKVTQEVEAEAAGVLLKIAVSEGEVPVGTTIAFIGEQGESVPEASENGKPKPQAEEPKAEAKEPEPEAAAEPEREPAPEPRKDGERIKASPLARRIARERGVDLAAIRGTGPDGRIIAEDLDRAAAAPARPAAVPAGEVESVPLTSIRRTIARRLTEAWTVPVFELQVSADMTRANAVVAGARELHPEVKVSVTDLLTKICASALRSHPDVNVSYTDDALLRHPNANVGIAVAAPQGLVVPVVAGADRLSLAEIAAVRADLVDRARNQKLARGDIEGGTFTISNLGMFGVEAFIAVLNPPQAAILAVGATEDRAVVRDGEVVVRPTMTMTLTVDHRAVDGAPAAEFLRTVKAMLEDPGLAL